MPIWATELSPYEELRKMEQTKNCGVCHSNLILPWDGKADTYVLRCSKDITHNTYEDKNRTPEYLRTEVAKGMTTAMTKMDKNTMLKRIDSVRWPADLTPALKDLLAVTAIERGLDPLEGELMIYQGKPYVGINGRLRKAQETGNLDGVNMRPGTPDEKEARRLDPHDYLSFVQVWKKGSTHSFEGWGVVHQWEIDKMIGICNTNQTDPMSLPIVKDPQNMADKRGKAAALKEAFHLPLPSIEDIPGGPPPRYDAESTARDLGNTTDMGSCPIHHKPFKAGKDGGFYCHTKVEGKWCKEKPSPKVAPKEPPITEEEQGAIENSDFAGSNGEETGQEEPLTEIKEGSDSWFVLKIVELGIKDASVIELLTSRYKIPIKTINTLVIGDNFKMLKQNQRDDLTKIIKDKLAARQQPQ